MSRVVLVVLGAADRAINEVVRTAYAGIDRGAGSRPPISCYSEAELAELPPEAVGWALGVGNPVRHAELTTGETVLDVGSGGGIDTILATRRVVPAVARSASMFSKRWSRGLAPMRPRPASTAGQSSSAARWSRYLFQTRRWTS
jgi:hypothetical protein